MGSHKILLWNGGIDPGKEQAILAMVLLKHKWCFLSRLTRRGGDHWGTLGAYGVVLRGGRSGERAVGDVNWECSGGQHSNRVEVKLQHDFVRVGQLLPAPCI